MEISNNLHEVLKFTVRSLVYCDYFNFDLNYNILNLKHFLVTEEKFDSVKGYYLAKY